ncbi:MAG: hypothetical protein H7259_04195 [Cytophagales bacterium]|nr:hypothetical protein [Cytophaga sp.]
MSFDKEIKRILKDFPQKINEEVILEVYKYQYKYNTVYKEYADAINRSPSSVHAIHSIPFLPITLFKTHRVETKEKNSTIDTDLVFYSSGTTSSNRSSHYVRDPEFYKIRSRQIFESYYGSLENTIILAVLPSYEENSSSSLVFMIQHFIACTKHVASGFYSFDIKKIKDTLQALKKEHKKVLVWGVSYALLDWAEGEEESYSDVIFLETGGMKGRRKELSRAELHQQLMKGFGVSTIHSEYGMTELLSQAYSKGNGHYEFREGLIPVLREINDPFTILQKGSGGLNIIDLANIDSCCFIETQDVGRITTDVFEIIGRIDASDIRGCNLLYI